MYYGFKTIPVTYLYGENCSLFNREFLDLEALAKVSSLIDSAQCRRLVSVDALTQLAPGQSQHDTSQCMFSLRVHASTRYLKLHAHMLDWIVFPVIASATRVFINYWIDLHVHAALTSLHSRKE